ncbi:LacI family DNA-binding transcriptional regulator [Uliginosibacterium sediminicola]|uniref:LacI family DNA-binding transcriptional regulator n=1 Tax=Uliginosibacterium sediminicola TaxID=2024550 RepID=A0ABU9YZY6_9RHOO
MTRISDVAKHAGVSVATVSRVLVGQGSVSEATRERVLASVKALDYHPDLAARRLRSGKTDTLGLIVSDIRNPYFTEVSRAIEDVAYARGMRVLLCNADEDPAKERFYLDMMRDENVAGVILSPTLSLLNQYRAEDFSFPLVLVDRCDAKTEADAVVLDNIDAAQRLTRHLLERNCRRIAFFYGAASATGSQRLAGYQAALAEAGLSAITQPVKPTTDDARQALSTYLERHRQTPDAVVASSGLILLGLVEGLRQHGLRYPQDVIVAGFDDMPWTRIVTPDITVMAQPTADIGRTAIELLLARIAQPGQAMRRIVMRGELIVRGSSAA